MALTATFTADFTKWNQALRDAQANLKPLEVSARGLQSQLQRLSSSLSGVEIKKQADIAVAAVRAVGGVTRLTETEQRRVNATVTEAIAKYRALGQQAPAELQKLEKELKDVNQEQDKLSKGGLFDKGSALLAGAVAGGVAAIGTAALSALRSLGRLAIEGIGALIVRGGQVADIARSFNALQGGAENASRALGIVRTATRGLVSDFTIMQASNKAALLGLNLTSQEMGDLAASAVTLGKAMGLEAGKSLEDLITALGRVSPLILDNLGLTVDIAQANERYAQELGKTASQLTEAERKQAFMNAALDAARQKTEELGGIQLTFADRIKVVTTQFGNLFDAIAVGIAQAPALNAALGGVGDAMTDAFGDHQVQLVRRIVSGVDTLTLAVLIAARDTAAFGLESTKAFGSLLVPLNRARVAMLDFAEDTITVLATLTRVQAVLNPFNESTKTTATLLGVMALEVRRLRREADQELDTVEQLAQGQSVYQQALSDTITELDSWIVQAGLAATAGVENSQIVAGLRGRHEELGDALGKSGAQTDAFAKKVSELTANIDRATRSGASLPQILEEYGAEAAKIVRQAPLFGAALTQPILAAARAHELLLARIAELERVSPISFQGFGTFFRDFAAADPFADATAKQFEQLAKLREKSDRDLRRITQSSINFQLGEVVRWANAQKALVDRNSANWQAMYDEIDRQAGIAILGLIDDTEEYKTAILGLAAAFPVAFAPLFAILEDLPGAGAAGGKDFAERFSGALNESLGEALGDIPQIIIDGILQDASAQDIAVAIGTTIGAAIGRAVGFALSGGNPIIAAIGESIGSLVGPLVDAIIKTRAERTVERVFYEFGVEITEALAQGIEDTAERRFGGDRQAAKLFHLDDIIGEAGGLSPENYRQLIARLRDVFSLVETGAFSSSEAIQVLDENFRTFAEFVTRGGSLATRELLEIIDLSRQLGLHSAEILAFTSEQSSQALQGFGGFIETRGKIFEQLTEAQAKLADLQKRAQDDSADIDVSEIQDAQREVDRLQQQLNAIPLTEGGAQAIGAGLFAIFEELTKAGQNPIEVLQQIDPLIKSLDEQMRAAGISGGTAFKTIKELAGLATDEISGPALSAIASLDAAFTGLHNAGLLNQETFTGLTEQVTATFDALIKQGVDGEKALRIISPTLQTIWELQKDFGFAVDEATQALIDQAVEAGVVGDKHRTVQEQMLQLAERQTAALEGLAELFGVVLPKSVEEFGDSIDGLPDEVVVDGRVEWDVELPELPPGPTVPIPGPGPKPTPDIPSKVPGFPGGTPNLDFLDFGRRTAVELHGREAVVPEGRELDFAMKHGLTGGGGDTYNVTVHASSRRGGEEAAEAFLEAIRRNKRGARTLLREMVR